MIKVSVLFPNAPDVRFDMNHYPGNFMLLVREKFGSACKGMNAPKPSTIAKFSYDISPDTGSSSHDRYSSGTTSNQLVFTGTGAAGDTIAISYVDDSTHQTVTLKTMVQTDGTWRLNTGSLPDGSYRFSITESGALSKSVKSSPWVVDTHTDVEISNAATISGQNTVTLTGTAEAGNTIAVTYVDPSTQQTVTVGTAVADSTGAWQVSTAALPDSDYTFTALATDRAGNTAIQTYSITIDTATSITISNTATTADQGTILLAGTSEVGDSITVTYVDPVTEQTVVAGSTTADGSGAWLLSTGGLANNSYTFTATATDAAGNTATSTYSITVETNPGVTLVGSDSNLGGQWANDLFGDSGNDTLNGGNASNSSFVSNNLFGNDGNDMLIGGNADGSGSTVVNLFYSGPGDDTLIGGSSSNGGYVANFFILDGFSVGDHVHGLGTDNTLEVYPTIGDHNLLITDSSFIHNGSTLDITGIQHFFFRAGNGNDVIDASQSGLTGVTLDGGSGNDTLIGGGSSYNTFRLGDLGFGDHVHGGGNDNLLEANGTTGDDNLVITDGGFVLNGSSLDVTNIQMFRYDAGDGNDVIDASQSGLAWVSLYGGGGNDTLIATCSTSGDAARNILFGGSGYPWASGSDTFVFKVGSGTSTILDFASSGIEHDVVDLSAYGFLSLDQVIASTTDYSTYCVIQLDSTDALTLLGIPRAALTADHFILQV